MEYVNRYMFFQAEINIQKHGKPQYSGTAKYMYMAFKTAHYTSEAVLLIDDVLQVLLQMRVHPVYMIMDVIG